MKAADYVRAFIVQERRNERLEAFGRDQELPPDRRQWRSLEDALSSVDATVVDHEVHWTCAHAERRLATGRAVISRYGVEWSADPVGAETIRRMTRRAEFYERLLSMLGRRTKSAV